MPKKDVNEFIADDFMRHSIDLDRLSEGERAKALRALKKLENELTANLKSTKKLTSFQAARTQALLQQTRVTISKTYKRLNTTQRESLKTIYEVEKNFVTQTLNNRIGASVSSVFIDVLATKAAVDGTLIEGAPSGKWWSEQSTRLKNKFENTIRTGVLSGETNDQIAKRVRGTKVLGFKDGLMQIPRHEASALVRTSTQAVANKARKDTYEENQDIIKAIQQISTLDTKTTLICMSYGGLTWSMQTAPDGTTVYTPIGHGKSFTNITPDGVRHEGPPRHWSCRSALSPVTKSWEELANVKVKQKGKKDEIFRDKFERRLKERGFSKDRIKRIEANTRSSMKGQVSKDIGQEGWLKTQKKADQIDALGLERWSLWKEGRIKDFQQLTDNSGRPLLVKEYIKRVKPKKLTPKPKKVAPPVALKKPVEFKALQFPKNAAPSEMKWHKKSWDTKDTPDDIKIMLEKVPALRGGIGRSRRKVSFYDSDLDGVFMRPGGWSSGPGTFRHEYGHHIDDYIGRNSNIKARGKRLRQGSSDLYFSHIKKDADIIIKRDNDLISTTYEANQLRLVRAIDTLDGKKAKLEFIETWLESVNSLNTWKKAIADVADKSIFEDPRRVAQIAQAFAADRKKVLTKRYIEKQIALYKDIPEDVGTWRRAIGRAGGDANFQDDTKVDAIKEALDKQLRKDGAPVTMDDLITLVGEAPRYADDMLEYVRMAEAIKNKDASRFLDKFGTIRITGRIIELEDTALTSSWDDLIGSITRNKVGDGHTEKYYNDRVARYMDNRGAVQQFSTGQTGEAFAQWISLRSWNKGRGAVNEKLIKWFTPNTDKGFQEMTKKYLIDWEK